MTRMGMDTDVVEQSGRQLKSQAANIGSLIAQLDKLVNSLPSVWDGQDAQQFVRNWWPQHKKALAAAQQSVDGLGQSALNNASEQRHVSSTNRASSASAAGVTAVATAATAAAAGARSAGDNSPGSSARAQAADRFVKEWQGNKIDPDHAYGAQCFDVFRQYSNEVVGARHDIATDSLKASDIYNHYNGNGVSQYYERIPYSQGTPQAGDIVVYGSNNPNDYGHVALVTSVDGNQYNVLEQNYNKAQDGTVPAVVRPHTFGEKTSDSILGYLRPKQVNT